MTGSHSNSFNFGYHLVGFLHAYFAMSEKDQKIGPILMSHHTNNAGDFIATITIPAFLNCWPRQTEEDNNVIPQNDRSSG